MRRRSISPSASIADIAAGIAKSSELLELEDRLSGLRARRDALMEQANVATGSLTRDNQYEVLPIVREIGAERAKVEDGIVSTRKAHAAVKAEHIAALSAALAPSRAVAEKRLRSAFDDLIAAWADLDLVDAELRRAGATVRSQSTSKQTQAIVAKLVFGAVDDHAGFTASRNARNAA